MANFSREGIYIERVMRKLGVVLLLVTHELTTTNGITCAYMFSFSRFTLIEDKILEIKFLQGNLKFKIFSIGESFQTTINLLFTIHV